MARTVAQTATEAADETKVAVIAPQQQQQNVGAKAAAALFTNA